MSTTKRQPPASSRHASSSRPRIKDALKPKHAASIGEAVPPGSASDDLKRSLAARAYSDSIIDTVREPLVVLDEGLRIISANRSFYATFALNPASAVGRHIAAGKHGFDTPLLQGFLARISAGDDLIEDYEIVIDLPSIGCRTLLLNGRKIGTAPRGHRKILVAIEDVTERKRVSTALQAAKAAAEQANRAKSRFLAAASHDLRQPLQTMSLLHGVLRRLVKDGQAQALANKLDDTLAIMTGMLNALLDINQIEAGIVRVEPSDFALADLLEPMRAEFSCQMAAKALAWRVMPTTAIVRSDRALLEEILRNLLSNAVKYTERGRILLGCRRLDGKVRIEVWDTGIGIGEEHLEAIFEEFHQIGNAARERSAGLGLGLFIARRLAELLDLRIEVRSRLGFGSVFSIEVPAGRVDAPRIRQPRVEEPAEQRSGAILIVDDDAPTRDMLALLFTLDGHVTATAADAREARALVAQERIRPDVILADYNLPGGMTGLELATALRAELGSALPVIILTGDISTESLRKIANAGCRQLTKPIKATELSQLVRSVVPAVLPCASATMEEGGDGTIFVVDDDLALRDALTALLQAEGRPVESFAGAEQFLAAYRAGRKGCLLVDVQLPGMSGLALLEHLKADGASLPAVMITGHGDVPSAIRAMEAGAVGFIEKPVLPDILLRAIGRAMAEGRDLAEVSSRRDGAAFRIAGLTPRERQVMALVVAGKANKEIAYRLGINQRTVENHRATLMKKTGSASLAELIHLDFAAREAGARVAAPPA